MSVEIICALIAVAGTALSAWVSWFVSRSTANKEIEKMQLAWEREDVVSSDDEFAEMAAGVAEFVQAYSAFYQRNALAKVAAIRSKETGELGKLLDDLYDAIKSCDYSRTNLTLSEVINEKRNAKSKCDAHRRNAPKE
ncbi:MAG: hypothetical protein ACI3VQ_06740 [Faecousia sp.]